MQIGNAIKQLRKDRQISLRALAQATGIDHTNLWRIENGKIRSPTWSTIEKVAKGLGMTASELVLAEEKEAA